MKAWEIWTGPIHGPAHPVVLISQQDRIARLQRPASPLLGPLAATAGGRRNLLDAGPLYAGESVARIHDLRPAGELVTELDPG